MAETVQSLEGLATPQAGCARSAEIREEGRCAGPCLCHRQAQERRRARLDQAWLRQDPRQHQGRGSVFRASGAADADPAAAGRHQSRRTIRRHLHRLRRRSVRPGRRGASRLGQGADLFRAGFAWRAQAGRVSSPAIRAWSNARNTVGQRRGARSSSRSASRSTSLQKARQKRAFFVCGFAIVRIFIESVYLTATRDWPAGAGEAQYRLHKLITIRGSLSSKPA